jgi:hypothetical protein
MPRYNNDRYDDEDRDDREDRPRRGPRPERKMPCSKHGHDWRWAGVRKEYTCTSCSETRQDF